MIEIDPGHEYLLDSYDGGEPVRLVFVKREGEGYPFNIGHHPGTNCQEVLRAEIKRILFLQMQEACDENVENIGDLRRILWRFEVRAARRHGRELPFLPPEIENVPTCKGCGHIGCEGNHKSAASPPTGECVWEPSGSDDYWNTSCGRGFGFQAGGPSDCHWERCPYCGRPLVEQGGGE